MASNILPPVNLACTMALQAVTAAVPADHFDRLDVRATNVGNAPATVDLVLTDGATTINRAKSFPVGFSDTTAAPDLEVQLIVPAGWYLKAKASNVGVVEVSVTGVRADTADFT